MVEGETLPTFDQLESSSKSSSLVDKKGTRYHIRHQNVVWETTEVISLQPTQSLLFPPSWYHRLVPPTDKDDRTSITLVAKYRMDPIVANGSQRQQVKQSTYMVMKPKELLANTTTKQSCYHILHVVQAMLQHQPSSTKKGIKLPSCHSIQKNKLYPMKKVGNLKQYYKEMIQKSQPKHPPNNGHGEL